MAGNIYGPDLPLGENNLLAPGGILFRRGNTVFGLPRPNLAQISGLNVNVTVVDLGAVIQITVDAISAPTGPTGPQGPAGSTGPQGPVGPVGATGPAGATGSLAHASTSAGAGASVISVVPSGTPRIALNAIALPGTIPNPTFYNTGMAVGTGSTQQIYNVTASVTANGLAGVGVAAVSAGAASVYQYTSFGGGGVTITRTVGVENFIANLTGSAASLLVLGG